MGRHRVAEDLRGHVRVGGAARVREQAGVARLPPGLVVGAEALGEPHRDHRALQPMLEREPHPEVGGKAQRPDHLGRPDRLAARSLVRHGRHGNRGQREYRRRDSNQIGRPVPIPRNGPDSRLWCGLARDATLRPNPAESGRVRGSLARTGTARACLAGLSCIGCCRGAEHPPFDGNVGGASLPVIEVTV